MIECAVRFHALPADPDAVYSPDDAAPVVSLRFEAVPRVGELLRLDGAGLYRVGLVEHTPAVNGRPPAVSLLLYEALDSWP